jgi:RNA polymerase sigma-70 factor (ECF subfamily)
MTQEQRELKLIELMTEHRHSVYGYIFSLTGNASDAEDILQSTYCAMWKKRDDFHGQGNFLTWACSFAKLQTFSHLRKSRRRQQVSLDEEALEAVAQETERQLCQKADRLGALRQCLANLPERQRELLNMRYRDAKSSAALASMRNTSESVIDVTMHRIRKALLRCIRTRLEVAT